AAEAHTRTEPAVDLEEARRVPLPDGASYLATVPVLLLRIFALTNMPAVDSGLDRLSISVGASVYPLAHNILLAARDAGYGGHFPSVLARPEPAPRGPPR